MSKFGIILVQNIVMKKNRLFYFLFLTIINFCNAFATDYYIDPTNGNDGNNGRTSTNAFKSLYKIDSINLQPGDTVFFMGGIYQRPGQTLLTINESGTEDNYITFTNFEDDIPVLEFDSWTGIDIIGGSSYININGLHVKGAREKVSLEDALSQGGSCANNFTGNVNGFYNGTGILAVGPNLTWSNSATTTVPHHINITNCEIYDCTSSGIAFQQADYITVTNNKVYDNCWYTIYGTSGINLYQLVNTDGTTGFHNEITNNLIYGNRLLVPQVSLELCQFLDGNAIIVDDLRHTQTENYKDPNNPFDSYTGKTLVANNIAVENGGSGLHFYLSSHCYILNNTVVNNASQNNGNNGNAELRIGGSTDFVIKNNIFKSNYRVHFVEFNNNIEVSNNYQQGGYGILDSFENCENCIPSTTDIEFLNTDVTSAYPYITNFTDALTDAGAIVDEINDDYLGYARPYGGLYDIGAYELLDCEPTTWYADIDNDGLGSENESILSCEQPDGYTAESGDLCPNDSAKTIPGECGCGEEEGTCEEVCETPINWYADIDNDGFGDPNEVIVDCEQPEGYVADSSDECINDANKSVPGECGCGEEEGTCNEGPEDICDSPEYSSSTIYAQAGTTVIYNGIAYENKWHTENQLPTSGGPWEVVGLCNVEHSDCSTIPSWSSTTIYSSAGNLVTYNQSIYENKWYISGDSPDTSTAWELVGLCDITLAISSFDLEGFNISNSIMIVKIYSLTGALVLEYTTDNRPNELNLAHGIYITHTMSTSTGNTKIEKIIVD